MKFRVKPKDFIIFVIFCVFLFIMLSLAILNLTSLLNNAEFFGLNFLAIFNFAKYGFGYLFGTIGVFIAVLVAIFLSVSDTIFSREKSSNGFGFIFKEKEEKGYSRWLTEKEMKSQKGIIKVGVKDENAEGAGIPIINNGKEMWVDDNFNHSLVLGITGEGKTTLLVEPMIQSLAKASESMILMDPKGELFRDHSNMLKSRGYNIRVLNFREPSLGNAWNPLTLPYEFYKSGQKDKAYELLDDIANNICKDPNNKSGDPFWENSATSYFTSLALGLFEDAKEDEINLSSIGYMASVGEERFATSNFIKEYFNLKGKESNLYKYADQTINAPDETKGSILSVFKDKMQNFTTRPQMAEMLSYSDFSLRDIGNEKTAVFIIIHDEKTTYHALATIFIKQVYETLIDVAQHSEGGKLKHRTNFILDEFANMPALRDIGSMVSASRSRRIRFTFIIQNFSQLNDVYGKETAETIRGNCGNLIYIIAKELAALEEISKLCGEVKSKDKEKTASTPLVTVSDLQKMKQGEVIIIKTRLHPFKTKLTPCYETDWGEGNFGEGKFEERSTKEVAYFDVQSYVKEAKRNKLFEALDSNKSGEEQKMPLGSIFGPAMERESVNPFRPNTGMFNLPDNADNPFMKNEKVDPSLPFKDDSLDKTEVFDLNKISGNTNFDVDSLVKRIDQKIAELEKQEEEEKKQNSKINEELDSDDKLNNTVIERFDDFIKSHEDNDDKEITEVLPVINIDNDSKVIDEVTDDEFFDDFFNDNQN